MTSRTGPIPNWDTSGILPPFVGLPTSGSQRSPYRVGLTDLVLRFSDTAKRRTLLRGLLDYRSALHNAGVREGFQWVNGSFVEDTTHRIEQDPSDIDVVTFLKTPGQLTQVDLLKGNPLLFDPPVIRSRYGLDAYIVVLDATNLPNLVRRAVYWNSLWSHDRTHRWKGYLEVDLSDTEDPEARAALGAAFTREVTT